jgi:hypothetical protein
VQHLAPGLRTVCQVRDRAIRTVDCLMINGGNAVPRHGGGRDDPGAQRQQRGDRTAASGAGPTHDGSGYGRSPASRSNMRVRTATGAGTPTLDVGQEGITHAESARSGRPVVTVQPRQRDARRVPASAAERSMSASSQSRGASGAPERRGAPSWARRRGSNSTTTADTPSPSADAPTARTDRTDRTDRTVAPVTVGDDGRRDGRSGTRRRAHHRLGPHTANQAEAGRQSKDASPHRRRPEPQERKAGPGRRNPPRARSRRPARPRPDRTRSVRRSRTCCSPPPTRQPRPGRTNPDGRPVQAGPAPRLQLHDHGRHTQPVCR